MAALKDSSASDLSPGDTVGHFEILDRLGEGGMGVVYRAKDRKLARTVALKFLPASFASGSAEAGALLQEARAASSLDHPNICTVYAIDETADGRAFIAMAAYEGETLRERLLRGPLSPAELTDVALQAARGLAAAHAQGTVHLDVKPGNLMITRDGLVKVLDFGLAKAIGESRSADGGEEPSPILGTAAYVSPEQVLGHSEGPASDLWSLGAVMYEMAAGRPPFGTGPSALDQIVDNEPPALQSIAPEMPQALARIIHKALAKDPVPRYSAMTELIGDLEALDRLPTVVATQPSRRRGLLRRRWPLAAAVLLLVSGTLWLTTRSPGAGEEGRPRNLEARALLEEATQLLRRMDGQAARGLLEEALALEPDNPCLHSALAESLRLLGREPEALRHGESAFAGAFGLSEASRLLYQARLALLRRDDEEAVSLLESLWETRELHADWQPGERLDLGLELILVRARVGREEAARQLLQELTAAQTAADPRLALAAATAAPNWQQHLQAARRAATLATDSGAPVVKARARFAEGRALRYLGQVAAATTALEDAAALYADLGHDQGQADALTTLGNLHWDQNDLTRAKSLYEQAVELYGAIGNSRLKTRPLTNKALVLLDLGDLEAAVEIFREALTAQRQLDDRLGQAYTLINLAGPLLISGRLEEAAEAYQQASVLAEELQDPAVGALVLESSAELRFLRGDLTGARSLLDEARALAERHGDRQASAQAGFRLGRLLRLQGDLEAARDVSTRALAIVEELGDAYSASLLRHDLGQTLLWSGDLENSRRQLEQALAIQQEVTDLSWSATALSLAELLILEGKPRQAEKLARQSAESFDRSRWVFEAARGYEILARSLVARRAVQAAAVEIDQAQKLLQDKDTPVYRLPILLAAAAVHVGAGDAEAARGHLQSALVAATTHGFLIWELEARLALAELDLAGGSARAARARLRSIAEEAEGRGLKVIARRARAAAG